MYCCLKTNLHFKKEHFIRKYKFFHEKKKDQNGLNKKDKSCLYATSARAAQRVGPPHTCTSQGLEKAGGGLPSRRHGGRQDGHFKLLRCSIRRNNTSTVFGGFMAKFLST